MWYEIPGPCIPKYGWTSLGYHVADCEFCFIEVESVCEYRDLDLYDRAVEYTNEFNGVYAILPPSDGCFICGIYNYQAQILSSNVSWDTVIDGASPPYNAGWELYSTPCYITGYATCSYKVEVATSGSTSQWLYDSASQTLRIVGQRVYNAMRYAYFKIKSASTPVDPGCPPGFANGEFIGSHDVLLASDVGYDQFGSPIRSNRIARHYTYRVKNPAFQ